MDQFKTECVKLWKGPRKVGMDATVIPRFSSSLIRTLVFLPDWVETRVGRTYIVNISVVMLSSKVPVSKPDVCRKNFLRMASSWKMVDSVASLMTEHIAVLEEPSQT